jgi:hypothetical protein
MSVPFTEVDFRNDETVFDVLVTIFAPPGMLQASNNRVKPGQTLRIGLPNVPDCSAVNFSVVADDSDHSVPYTKTYDVSPKVFRSIKVAYADGEFQLLSEVTADPQGSGH